MLLALSDDELVIVMAAAQPLRAGDREKFLVDVAGELAKYPERGPGIAHRIVRVAQRKYFDPPDLRGSMGKYD